MFKYFVRKLGKLIALAAVGSSVSALLALSLFGMVSQVKTGALLSFSPLQYAVAWCALLAASTGASLLLSRLSANAVYEVRMSLVQRILATPYDQLEQAGSARLHNVLGTDVANVANTFSELPTFIFNLILLICCLSYLAYLSPLLFLVLAAAVVGSFFVSRAMIRQLGKRARSMRESQDAMMEGYRGMLEGRAQLATDAMRKSWFYENDLQTRAQRLRGDERGFRLFWDINRAVTLALIFLLLGVVVEAGRRLGEQEVVMSYALIITYCAGPFAIIISLLQMFAQARVSMEKIDSLQIGALSDPTAPVAAARAWRTIRFSQVEYVYRQQGTEEPFVLGPIDLELRRGEVTFITGGNGSGKSTFLKLLLGLHEPSAGIIYIDGVPQAWSDKESYCALFAMVLSDFYLFPQVLDAKGKAADDDKVRQLLARFKLDTLVKVHNGAFDTVRLSQGQKKRLALVSAIAQDKDIYVLDEWAADQDPQYRKVFYEEIIPWLKATGKTVVAVTHDDRYFSAADQCIHFEGGRVRDDGVPAVTHAVPQPVSQLEVCAAIQGSSI